MPWSLGSGIWTESGKGDVGRGFCDANAPAAKLARVGVVASSMGFGVWLGAVLGRGVMADGADSSLIETADVSGELTGRNAAAIMRAYRSWRQDARVHQDWEGRAMGGRSWVDMWTAR